jgi:serine/threonine-protein kinase RsbT
MTKRLDLLAALEREGTTVPGEVRVPIDSDSDVVLARRTGRAIAADIGFTSPDLALIAATISELAHNLLAYASDGEITVRTITDPDRVGLVVVADDNGPGIPDVDRALLDGYSTSGGLGLGLPGVRRLMDEFVISSHPGMGTTVTVTKWRR